MHVTVENLLPLVAKLTWDERIRLAQLALEVADSEEREGPAAAYRIVRSAIAFHIETFGSSEFEQDDPVVEVFVAETRVAV